MAGTRKSRCSKGSRKNKSGNCSPYSGSFGLRKLYSSRCKKGFRKVRSGKNKGSCKPKRQVY